jgi:hypothetical protein
VTWQDVAFALASVVPGDHTLGITPRWIDASDL